MFWACGSCFRPLPPPEIPAGRARRCKCGSGRPETVILVGRRLDTARQTPHRLRLAMLRRRWDAGALGA